MSTAVIIDTNVFVAAGFNRRSASAQIVELARCGKLRMIWSNQTRTEARYILTKIPRLSWEEVAGLFRNEDRYEDIPSVAGFSEIRDPDDRKFAALAEATDAVLLTNDSDLLSHRDHLDIEIFTPGEYWEALQE
jgi:putative PIN family toxin of toxin-antitoxin system